MKGLRGLCDRGRVHPPQHREGGGKHEETQERSSHIGETVEYGRVPFRDEKLVKLIRQRVTARSQ